MKALITGITGMIGSAYAEYLRDAGWDVVGVARSSANSRLAAVDEDGVIRCDILDRDAVSRVVRDAAPDVVLHFAAQAFNGTSWRSEQLTLDTNITGTRHVLQAVLEHAREAKLLLACSSAEYGIVDPADQPLTENRLLRPVSPYGVSKVATECLGAQYAFNHGLKVYLPRLFIHVGVGHPPATAIQNFARQLALMAAGRIDPVLRVGNLDSARDFIDVRDGVRAMHLLLDQGPVNAPVNVCSGKAHTIRDVLDMLVRISGVDAAIEQDPALGRPSDEQLLLGDNTKLRELGWSPDYTLEQTLADVYEDWVSRVRLA